MANSITENFYQREVSFSLNLDFFPEAAVGASYDSKIFHLTNDVNYPLRWIVKVFPSGDAPVNKDYVSLYLQLITCDKPAYIVDFRICILKKNGLEVNECRLTNSLFSPNCQAGFPRFVRQGCLLDPANGLMRDNHTLRILCSISRVVEYNSRLDTEGDHTSPKPLLQTLPHEFLGEGDFTDVVIEAHGGVKFGADKKILLARSPRVLAAMIEQENYGNVVKMHDMESGTVYAMLEYLYTGRVYGIKAKSSKLIGAAEKYGLEELKDQCERSLCERLTVENAAECLVLAEHHNAKGLKSMALNFSAAHLKEVMDSPGYSTAANTRPELATDILSFIAQQYSSGAWPKPLYHSVNLEEPIRDQIAWDDENTWN